MELKRFQKWAEREYSAKRRIIALIFESILFVIVIPFFLAMVSHFLDQWLQLPRFVHGLVNPLLSLLLIVRNTWGTSEAHLFWYLACGKEVERE